MRGNGKPKHAKRTLLVPSVVTPGQAPVPLMQVQVRFYGIRRELVDEPCVELQVPQDASLRMVLQALGACFGERVQQRLFSADGAYLNDMLCVAVNGQIVGDAELDAPLPAQGQGKQRMDLSVIFAIAGG